MDLGRLDFGYCTSRAPFGSYSLLYFLDLCTRQEVALKFLCCLGLMPCICACGVMIPPTGNKHGDQTMQINTPGDADGLNGAVQRVALHPYIYLFFRRERNQADLLRLTPLSLFLFPLGFSFSFPFSSCPFTPSLSLSSLSLALLLYLALALQVPLQQNTVTRGTSIPFHFFLSFLSSPLLFFLFLINPSSIFHTQFAFLDK